MSLSTRMHFLSAFLKQPATIGAIAPSSTSLARKMTEWIDWPNVEAVVEYGPGTGVFTESIVACMQPGTKFFAVELNERFIDGMTARYPDVRVFHDSVENIQTLCRQEGVAQVDAIVSGLPWASFSSDLQRRLLDATTGVLRPGGQFATFAYLQGLLLPAGQRFRKNLRDHFSQVQLSKTAWLNLPPAFVYRCRR